MNPIFFRKIIREFWSQRARSLLVVLSLAVGIFAVGATAGAQHILAREMRANLQAIHPAHLLAVVSAMTPAQLDAIGSLPEVAAVEGRSTLMARAAVANAQGGVDWRNITLHASPDANAWTIDAISPIQGTWPPPADGVVLERGSLAFLNVQADGELRLQNPHGDVYTLPIAGIGRDLYQANPTITAGGAGYVSPATLRALGGPQGYTQLHIQLAPAALADAVTAAKTVRRTLEAQGVDVLVLDNFANGDHPLAGLVQGVVLVLGLMGGLALLLSGFLVVNTITALLAEQTRQIGVLKAIGARRSQVLALYLALTGFMGLAALLLALPLGAWGAAALSSLFAGLINLDLSDLRQPGWVYALQVALGLLVPLGAALIPVVAAARQTVHAALNDYGLGSTHFGQGWLDRLVSNLGGPVTLRMAVRNALRRKPRLAFTLATLTLASAIAISVFSVQSATRQTLAGLRGFFRHDLYIQFSRPVDSADMLAIVRQNPNVERAEAWALAAAITTWNGVEEPLALWAGPADTSMLHPNLTAGRWLQTGDTNAIVIDTHLTSAHPELTVGSTLTLTLRGQDVAWQIVGIFETVPNRIRPTAMAYVTDHTYTIVTGTEGLANEVWVQGKEHTASAQSRLMTELDQTLKAAGMSSDWAVTGEELNNSFASAFNILIAFLLVMAALLGFVGGLGLMGMIGLNVLERRRELGVLRAVGARSGLIARSLAAESAFVAVLAWGLGALLALPLSAGMCWLVGMAFLNAPFAYSFSVGGAAIWLAVIMVLALLSSLLPARRAVQAPVAEVLLYE
jgi:putative ABC transport system permease protein